MSNKKQTEKTTGPAPVVFSVTDAAIAKLRDKYKEVPADLTIKENYEIVKEANSALRTYRTDVERRRKELKAGALKYGRLVDSTAKKLTEQLLLIEEPFSTAKKNHDTAVEIAKREAALAEEKRVDGIADKIAGVKALVESNILSSSEVIQAAIDGVNNLGPAKAWAMEFAEKADTVITESLAKLEELRVMKFQQENQAAEAAKAEEKRQKAEEKRLKEEEEARIKREAQLEADREKLANELAAMEAEKAKFAAEQAQREAQLKAEKEAAEKANALLIEEIANIKKASESEPESEPEKQEIIKAPEEKKEESPAVSAPEAAAPVKAKTTGYSQDYKDSGNALLAMTGNKILAKAVLDAIINGDIPHIIFNGEI